MGEKALYNWPIIAKNSNIQDHENLLKQTASVVSNW